MPWQLPGVGVLLGVKDVAEVAREAPEAAVSQARQTGRAEEDDEHPRREEDTC